MYAFLLGLICVALLGTVHHFCLRALDRVSGHEAHRPNLSILIVFNGLLALHVAEILGFAVLYRVLFSWEGLAFPAQHFTGNWIDFIYFSGINFVTLGYTQIQLDGPVRLVSMMQSLGGFMVLTWSATFIFAAWQRAFRDKA